MWCNCLDSPSRASFTSTKHIEQGLIPRTLDALSGTLHACSCSPRSSGVHMMHGLYQRINLTSSFPGRVFTALLRF